MTLGVLNKGQSDELFSGFHHHYETLGIYQNLEYKIVISILEMIKSLKKKIVSICFFFMFCPIIFNLGSKQD